ncbi:hypothetical protein [Bradyrhizobium sp. 187]|uniref:hypothetical protein n=1 Tax=Bradyrhizobium sp. 187 TaxID=2782655 RepID=UPI00200018E9|nr:hypothetical protein [Bradyrhizobium sp. 187]
MNFQVTVLKILVSYPDGFAVMEDIKRDMAILATSGREWPDRTKRLAARELNLDIFSHGMVERISGGWQITAKGDFMQSRPRCARTDPGTFGRGGCGCEVATTQVKPALSPARTLRRA